MKKAVCLLLALCLAVFSGACAGKDDWALDIAGARISPEIYAYYLDAVIRAPGDYGLSPPAAENLARDKAAELCQNYVAANTLLSENGIELTAGKKAAVASRVSGLWNFYSGHYEAIGVTRQTVHKIETANAAKEALLLYFFDSETEKAATEDAIRAYYSETFLSFVSINGYLTKTMDDGATVKLSAEEAAALAGKFEAMRVRITEGDSFEAVGEWFAADSGTSAGKAEYKMIKKGGVLYPDGFFEALAALAPGTPGIIQLDQYIFLVMRSKPDFDSENYTTNRTGCLDALKGVEIDKMIRDEAARYTVKTDNKTVERVYKTVAEKRDG